MRTLLRNRSVPPPLLLTFLGLLVVQAASARAGGVDYSWGASALARAHDFAVTMMLYVCILTILTPILMMLTPSKRAGLSKSSPCLLANRQRCSYKVIAFSFS